MKNNKILNIGFGNAVFADKVIAIVSPESAPIKRLVQEAREKSRIIDATYGRRTRSVIVAENEYVILSAIQPETITSRFTKNTEGETN